MAEQTASNKPVVATISLAGCFGCHMSFLDIDERTTQFIELFELHKSPLNDIKRFEKRADVGLIEGGVCNDENVEVLRYFRENCDVLVSVGACAGYGGLPALRNKLPLEECLVEAYLDAPTAQKGKAIIPHDEELPKLLDQVYPCHDVVKIDYYMPGCPPTADVFWDTLSSVIKGQGFDLPVDLIKYD